MGGEDYDMRFFNFMEKERIINEASSLAMERCFSADDWRDKIERAKALRDEYTSYGSVACQEAYQTYNDPWNDMWEALNEHLNMVFDEAREFFEDRKADFEANAFEKQGLVNEANQLLNLTNLKDALARWEQLFEQWKAIGSAGEFNEELWQDFRGVKSTLLDRRKALSQERNSQFGTAKAAKLQIIEEARQLSTSTQWGRTSARFNELFEAMKTSGFAGKEEEQVLWAQFKQYKSAFHERRIASKNQVANSKA